MDEFSDDDFDTLNPNVLQELENNAIQFTQAQKKYQESQSQTQFVDDFEDDDLDDAVVQDELRGNPILPEETTELPSRIVPQQQYQQQYQQQWGGPVPVPASRFRPETAQAPSRNPLPAPTSSRQPQQQQSISRAPPPSYSQIRPPPPLPRPTPSIPQRYQASQAQRPNIPSNHEISALQAQILDLKTRLTTKDGEIGIVRKRLEKTREDYERELQTIKKQAAEQVAKHEKALEAAKAAQQAASTELEFTRRDLKGELDRAKRKDGPATPKKNTIAKSRGIADGFEDVEMAGSPSKGRRGRNTGAVAGAMVEPPARLARTPTKGKRKRLAADSPIGALETHSEDAVMLDDTNANDTNNTQVITVNRTPKAASFDYMKVILSHSYTRGGPLAFESLANYRLPSRPTESLASILFQKLAVIGDPQDPMRLPTEFCEQVIELWRSCHKEGILEPIMQLVSLIYLTVQLYTVAVAPYIAPSLLPVAMDSCFEVGIPRFYHEGPGDPLEEAWKNFNRNISTTEILSLLYLTALGCAASPPVDGITDPAVDFWSQVQVEFVLLHLSQKHPVEDYLTILRWLCTSVFPDSIGPISPDRTVEVVAGALIERISHQLVEKPRWKIDQYKQRVVRNAVLRTLAAFARSPFGLAQLAINDYAIPRLVTLLSSCIDELYDGDMRYESSDDDSQKELQTMVARTVLLLHTIITNPLTADLVNVSGKLAKPPGVSQKYLLSLGRLNFSEDLVSEETAELAHELLELAVTPEEGEELGRFFGG
ncbi:uncharacterized protein F4812DRAFT_445449 [Daldinia caldariorum]|uniref:uncharacterized protein n=1 Tax=Daldinia caldariorum TaxID=326644 RepID=UPI0020080CED|nr:uncharacterized protein F4812DRAFT_445449 [Daldinia caldariorum]KAI1463800.1 hypothetical protein F4812DRAFT_445449 [Daldinia caldariorum]